MREYSIFDRATEKFLPNYESVRKQVDAMNAMYWVYVNGSTLIGELAVGVDPLQITPPPGTVMGFVMVRSKTEPFETISTFIKRACVTAERYEALYCTIEIESSEKEIIEAFRSQGFGDHDDYYRMTCPLDGDYASYDELEFKQVSESEMREFFNIASEVFKGSLDPVLERDRNNYHMLPDKALRLFYNQESFFTVYNDDTLVGVINYHPTRGRLSNMGVQPQERGKGYGRKIAEYGLRQLKEQGNSQAYLRAYVNNEPAIHLYRSLGFSIEKRNVRLMRRSYSND